MPRQQLKQRSDGYFRVKYHGKQFYGKTQKEAFRKRDEYKVQEVTCLAPNAREITFLSFGLEWVASYHHQAGKTLRKQLSGMVEFAAENLQSKRVVEISVSDLQRVCDSLSGYSSSHVRKFMAVLRGIFKSACANGIRLTNPMDGVRTPKTLPAKGHRILEDWERDLVRTTWQEHDFGPAAMVMLYAGLRRGEVLHLDIDRDVDFAAKTITVNGAVAFPDGNQPVVTPGKTAAAQRTIPLAKPLERALWGRHGLLLATQDGRMMTLSAFDRKYASYITFLETRLNGCHKRWYGKTREHKAMLEAGGKLPPWRNVTIRCHDFRKDFCTRNSEVGVLPKTLQTWMGHAGPEMINRVYTGLTEKQAALDAEKMRSFLNDDLVA